MQGIRILLYAIVAATPFFSGCAFGKKDSFASEPGLTSADSDTRSLSSMFAPQQATEYSTVGYEQPRSAEQQVPVSYPTSMPAYGHYSQAEMEAFSRRTHRPSGNSTSPAGRSSSCGFG